MNKLSVVTLLLLLCLPTFQSQAANCGNNNNCTVAASQAAPKSATSQSAATQLTRLHDIGQLSKTRIDAAAASTTALLVRQNLQALDPENQLSDADSRKLSLRLNTDIRPEVNRAFRALDSAKLAAAMVNSYQQLLSDSELTSLLDYYRSKPGQHYLAFNKQLDRILGDSLARIAGQPFSFTRAQQATGKIKQQRLALISMSSLARQLEAGRTNGANRSSSAALSLALDLIATQSGSQLDNLALRYKTELAGFNQFQHSPAAVQEAHAQWQWGEQSALLLAPALEQAKQQLATQKPQWQQQAEQMLATKTPSTK